ncbi:MAG: purine-nucleoside phosphorylase [Chitinophagaceae bacterium]|nr:purine-nucleoside phosphorylase [Chitinophagaceae bacterium]
MLTPSMIAETAVFLRSAGVGPVQAAVVLGTGLGQFAEKIESPLYIPFADIPHFPEATAESHKGQLIYGHTGGKPVLAMQGRYHYYEGYSMQQITFPIRVMKILGASSLFLSNAAGGLNLSFHKGDLVLIEDHINLLPDNPLRGLADPALGPRFVDMSAPYSSDLMAQLIACAASENISLKKGTYVAVPGPSLETRAEYRWLRSTGADMVGMSTVPEVIVANQLELPCAAVSVITDECDPDNLQPVNIPEIMAIAAKADSILSNILEKVITGL